MHYKFFEWIFTTSTLNKNFLHENLLAEKVNSVIMLLYSPLIQYAITAHIHKSHVFYIHAVAFSAGLNTFQSDQINREVDNRAFTYTQLVCSKVVTACNTHVQ